MSWSQRKNKNETKETIGSSEFYRQLKISQFNYHISDDAMSKVLMHAKKFLQKFLPVKNITMKKTAKGRKEAFQSSIAPRTFPSLPPSQTMIKKPKKSDRYKCYHRGRTTALMNANLCRCNMKSFGIYKQTLPSTITIIARSSIIQRTKTAHCYKLVS